MQKLQLSIPEPCHENWQQMTPTQQGRFCNACAKEVIDFSAMTDIQVLNYFTTLTHEKVCGRALPEQLDRTISRPAQPKKRIFWYWNYFVMFLMFFAKGNSTKAQNCTKPATELSPVKNVDVRGDVVVVAGQIKKQHVVSGKVIDNKGEPVPFASIINKEAKYGVATDGKGEFKINAASNSILSISAAGYKTVEIEVDTKTAINVVLENFREFALGGVIVVQSYVDGVYQYPSNQNLVAGIVIKDWETLQAIQHAKIFINKGFSNNSDIVFSDNSGKYKIKEIKPRDKFNVKIEADGYEPNEFTVDGAEFKDRKKEWEVLLRKKKTEPLKPLLVKPGTQTPIRLGGMIAVNKNTEPLYIVDGIIAKKADEIKPEDIDDVTVLQGPAAAALFGSDGTNGAIVITTRKFKEKKLEQVTVSADFKSRKMGGMTAGYRITYLNDTKARLMTILTDSLKVYPNPVQRNSSFSVALKLKEAGAYQIQFTDATGKIILQKQISTLGKVHVETWQPQNWAAGIYYVRIFSKNKLISSTSFIFE
jgi:TonB-dependent SusC/RagA subfamily outer membrane receptor